MANGQNTKTVKGLGRRAGILGDSTSLPKSESMPLGESVSSPIPTTATTLSGSQKIWTSAEFQALQLKAGLVAGALADWQTAGGLVAVKNIEFEDGRFATKIYLVADGISMRANKTPDGLDFDLVALDGGE